MTKKSDKNKKDSEKKKTQETKASRGRPTDKEEKNVTEKKIVEKKQPVKINENVKEPVVDKVVEPQLSESELLIKEIYGDEPIKNVIPFPNSTQKTQTTGIVEEFAIDVKRLPQDILNLVNDFITDFTTLASNPMMVQLVNAIIEKDTKSFNALKEWVEPVKDKLLRLKIKTVGGISITTDNTAEGSKKVIDSNNINSAINSMPINQGVTHTTQTINQPQSNVAHTINPSAGVVENKDIFQKIMSESNAFSDVHKNQNPFQSQPEQKIVVAPEKYIKDYADSIIASINGSFQIIHWGYIPLDVLKGILSNADSSFGYEIVQGTEDGYINISKGSDKVSTPRFKIQ